MRKMFMIFLFLGRKSYAE